MTRRTASMDLEWERIFPDVYRALLPDIPGYTTGSSDNYVDIEDIGGSWMFTIWLDLVCGFPVCLFNKYFDIPYGSSFEEMKQAVENLSIEDIVRKVAERGDRLVDDEFTDEELEAFHQLIYHNQYVTSSHSIASRQASHRIASLDLDWEETMNKFGDLMYEAVLPAIPGYPYSGDGNSTVGIAPNVYDTTGETYTWWMDIEVGKNDNVRFYDNELTGVGPSPLDYVMDYLDGLSVEWIADKLAEKGYMPDED